MPIGLIRCGFCCEFFRTCARGVVWLRAAILFRQRSALGDGGVVMPSRCWVSSRAFLDADARCEHVAQLEAAADYLTIGIAGKPRNVLLARRRQVVLLLLLFRAVRLASRDRLWPGRLWGAPGDRCDRKPALNLGAGGQIVKGLQFCAVAKIAFPRGLRERADIGSLSTQMLGCQGRGGVPLGSCVAAGGRVG